MTNSMVVVYCTGTPPLFYEFVVTHRLRNTMISMTCEHAMRPGGVP